MTTLRRRSLGVFAAGLALGLAVRAENAPAANTRGDALLRAWDADHDGTLDLNEVKQAATARFNQMDTDHDGTIDRKDRGRALVTADVRAADADHNGSVSLDEYLALAQTRFEAADVNHDGTLDARELNSNAGRTLMRLLK